jgi:hypothetical protein
MFLVLVKFLNLDFGLYKKKSIQFAHVNFKLVSFNPSFDMLGKKTHYVGDAMLDSCVMLAFFW